MNPNQQPQLEQIRKSLTKLCDDHCEQQEEKQQNPAGFTAWPCACPAVPAAEQPAWGCSSDIPGAAPVTFLALGSTVPDFSRTFAHFFCLRNEIHCAGAGPWKGTLG